MGGTLITVKIAATVSDEYHWTPADREAAEATDADGQPVSSWEWVRGQLAAVADEAVQRFYREHPDLFRCEPSVG